MDKLLIDHFFLTTMLFVIFIIIIVLLIIVKPWFTFICYSKTDESGEDDIRYNMFNKTYYYCHNDHYGCVWKDKLTNSQLIEYDLIATKPLENKKVEKKIKNKTKMEKSKPSLLLKILKRCFLILIIILTYKIGLVIIETVPNLIKNQLTTINK